MSGRLLRALALGVLALLALASPALGAFGFKDLGVAFSDSDGSQLTQAGSHPYAMETTLNLNTLEDEGQEVPDGELRDLEVELPPGFAGDPTAVPYCPAVDFVEIDINLGRPTCPDSSVVGIAAVKLEFHTLPVGEKAAYFHTPIYNLMPPPGSALKLGFAVKSIPVTILNGVREEAPNRVFAKVVNTPQSALFYGSKVTLWGNPANEEHDEERGSCVDTNHASEVDDVLSLGSCHVDIPEEPLLTLPRSCTGPLQTDFRADSWQNPGAFVDGQALTDPGMTGCAKLAATFGPEMSAQPTTHSGESAMGMDIDVDVEDIGLQSSEGTAQSDIKKTVVSFPAGVSANPAAAEGLGACTPADYGRERISSPPGAGCPESAKIGSVEAQTPLLEGEILKGAVYVAQPDDPATAQAGAENPFDTLLAFYLVIKDPLRGVMVKLPAKVEPDPKTGQLVSTIDDIPQFPVSHFHLHLREGARAPLVSPRACGTYTTRALFTPWADPAKSVERTASFTVNAGPGGGACAGSPAPFHPRLQAGSIDASAGSYSPFYLRLNRQDGEQEITRLSAVLPDGLTGKLAGVPSCPDSALALAAAKSGRQELADPSCPAGSQIGRVLAGAGVGPALTYVSGKVYLGGPFAGDPLSVIVITPALAGPFDAGTVVTREALTLDPETAEVKIDGTRSDPLPRILKGIPLKLRELRVYADRPQFTLNPTNCEPSRTLATVFGDFLDVLDPADDAPVSLTSPYQASDCASLGFKPKLSLKLTGGTKRSDHPALSSVLVPRPGDANIGRAVVKLPRSEFIDNAHIQNPCTRVQFNENRCPKGSILGHATAVTPLLDAPLKGTVYFRSNGGERLLPDIVVDLKGQFRIVLVGKVDAVKGRIRTIFEPVPDAPVTKFTLKLNGGKKGLLVNSTNLCAKPRRVSLQLRGQNGRPYNTNPAIATSCGKKKAKPKGQ
jgi:hypothetical protein